MSFIFKAAVLHKVGEPLVSERVALGSLGVKDVLVRVRAAGICHTDLEVIQGSLRIPLPAILGHEAAGVVERVGPEATGVSVGDHVVLSWNPHCGDCYYCDRDLPILCEQYLANSSHGRAFDGSPKMQLNGGRDVHQLMFLGAFSEYCVVTDQQAIRVPKELPFDCAALIGCGVMTGAGAALNVSSIGPGASALIIGCGAVGLAAIQGARLTGAETIIAADRNARRLDVARAMGATHCLDVAAGNPIDAVRSMTAGRGVDAVFESAGHPDAFRLSVEAVRPGGEVVWLGKVDVNTDVAFRWGALMQEKRIRRSSYGNARPRRDFPLLARAYLKGDLNLDDLITNRLPLERINEGIDALRSGQAIRTVVELPG